MLTTVTPTLNSSIGFVTDVSDQIATLLRFIIMNPGWISSIWESRMLSFRSLTARYEHDRDIMTGTLTEMLNGTLSRMFPDFMFDVQITADDYIEGVNDGRYTVRFNIIMKKVICGATMEYPGLVSGTILVDKTKNTIEIKYDSTSDNIYG